MYFCTAWHSFPNSWQIVYLFMNGYTNIAFGSLELEHLILFLFETSSKFFLSHDRSMSYLDSICIRAKSHSCKKNISISNNRICTIFKVLKKYFQAKKLQFQTCNKRKYWKQDRVVSDLWSGTVGQGGELCKSLNDKLVSW